MAVEVINLKATKEPNGVLLTWGVNSTSYLVGFEVIIQQIIGKEAKVVTRFKVPASARETSVGGLSSANKYRAIVRAEIQVGGKNVEFVPAEGSTVIPFTIPETL